ncbi:ribonuclease H-like protein [Trametopsis cervina]|nr:ribonuclease H-like protein [Trametopsis cervina]
MFSTLGLFDKLPCPEKDQCKRPNCVFSHSPDVKHVPTAHVPVDVPKPVASSSKVTPPEAASGSKVVARPSVIPAKRPVTSTLARANNGAPAEPPRKLQKVGSTARPVAVPSSYVGTDGVPILRVNAAQSQVAIPVRQTMVKTLWEHYKVLYEQLLERNPNIAAEHSLRHEEEVYAKSTKLTYRNAVISSIASLKRRPKPDNINHPSVGTEGDISRRDQEKQQLESLKLTTAHLEPYILTEDEMKTWDYVVEIPEGIGGEQPSEEGNVQKCERCNQPFQVKRREEADECLFHWGKPFTREKRRVYMCCSRTTDEEPCSKGPHVFYEREPELLHRRHAFSHTRPASDVKLAEDTALDIVALDCEMIYSTGGMRVARVSVVDGTGKEVFDELVRMDDGVEVIDFNTRFSGVTPEAYATAVLQLSSIRKSLDALINSNTIIIGHALDNDLKTLRMIHHRCVDTVAIFPHQAGPPYRRALRVLSKEHLGRIIQTGGAAAGHSSVEDSIATLDLVRWHVLNGPKPKPKGPPVTSPTSASS